MTDIERLPFYNPPIPDNLRITYEKFLAGIIRWENGTLSSSREENDLEHTRDMLIILEDMEHDCPNIAGEVDFTTVYPMAYIHDAGEIYAGDLAHTHPDYDNLKPQVKRREKAGFRLLTRALRDERTKHLARELYERVEQKSPTDKESQLVDLVDKIQAMRFGIKYVYPGDRIVDIRQRIVHLNRTANVLLKPAEALIYALESPYSKREAVVFMRGELEHFTSYSYSYEEIQPYLSRISSWSIDSNHHQSIATHGEIG